MRWILLLLACAVAVQARPQAGRTLSASTCSRWCSTDAGSCVLDKTSGNAVCRKCQNRMVPIRTGADAGKCGCPAGRYFNYGTSASTATCKDCELGFYCTAKPYAVADNQAIDTGSNACTSNLTTKRKRSTLQKQCVTLPGYYYSVTNNVASGTACPVNTYNPGLNYATSCTPCPAGFSTNGTQTNNSPQDCLVPPGYFLSGPGQVAPCPRGSFQPNYLSASNANKCTPCPEGITTQRVASNATADCNRLLPGYYASGTDETGGSTDGALIGTLCPTGYYCPGSTTDTDVTPITFVTTNGPVPAVPSGLADSTVKRCDTEFSFAVNGTATAAALWTRNLGASNKSECYIPPGHFVNQTGSTYTVTECADGYYQEAWVRPFAGNTTTCTSCGTNIPSDAITPLKYARVKTLTDNDDVEELSVDIRGSPDACYLRKGWGMYYVLDSANSGKYVFKAQRCNTSNYGATAEKSYGLTATPCKNCPVGMESMSITALTSSSGPLTADGVEVAIWDNTTSPEGAAFVHPLSCVTKSGYGYDGRSATPCPLGTYSAGGDRSACTPCDYGYTTNSTNATSVNSCLIAPGFGWYNESATLCPKGTYNALPMQTSGECTTCLDDKYTTDLGADDADECSVCKPGYGGVTSASCTDCSSNSPAGYGPEFRSDTQCLECPTQTIGYSFFYLGELIPYTSAPVSRSEATSSADCVSQYAQIESGLWYLAGAVTANGADTLADCVTVCNSNSDCMFVNFNYTATSVEATPADTTGECKLAEAVSSGNKFTAFKVVPAGDVGSASVKSVSTGLYTQWLHDGSSLGETPQEEITTTDSSKSAAFEACDNDIACAGVYCPDASLTSNTVTGNCFKIKGLSTPGDTASVRSLTRAVPAKFPQLAP